MPGQLEIPFCNIPEAYKMPNLDIIFRYRYKYLWLYIVQGLTALNMYFNVMPF